HHNVCPTISAISILSLATSGGHWLREPTRFPVILSGERSVTNSTGRSGILSSVVASSALALMRGHQSALNYERASRNAENEKPPACDRGFCLLSPRTLMSRRSLAG